jgi:hypothetical protein
MNIQRKYCIYRLLVLVAVKSTVVLEFCIEQVPKIMNVFIKFVEFQLKEMSLLYLQFFTVTNIWMTCMYDVD